MARFASRRVAQIGISVLFLVLVRSLAEFFRLRTALGPERGNLAYASYPGGLLMATVGAWIAVLLYFGDRYRLATAAVCWTVVVLVIYKVLVID